MIELVVIADDFTGALDTGIKFAQTGANTRMFIGADIDFENSFKDCEIVIVDTETRHKEPAASYKIVRELVEKCRRIGVPRYYKKTDSALRGCVGAELTALADALEKPVHFVPALPSENRYTEGGIHYIDGIPVSESVFGKDPFEPVRHDKVSDIIRDQEDVTVIDVPKQGVEKKGDQDRGIYVYDARTQEDLERIAVFLEEQGDLGVTAGCAGFARVLRDCLPTRQNEDLTEDQKEGLFTVCGTINAVTLNQIQYAHEHGFERITLSIDQKLMPGYLETAEGRAFTQMLEEKCRGLRPVIIDVDPGDHYIREDTVREYGLEGGQAREKIAERLGQIAQKWMEFSLDHVLLLSGGDTAFGFLNYIGIKEVIPVREVWQGAVLFKAVTEDRTLSIVSKSGGFGDRDFFVKILPLLVKA